jgi:NDP-sugar pyrophosphorylase family protein
MQAMIMAGGEGRRLRPLTEQTPKPLLRVGDKPIIQYNIEHLVRYGIDRITISIKYLGNQLRDYFKDGSEFGCRIDYIEEENPMGTIGALAQIRDKVDGPVLLMNSDVLTNIDLEDQYLNFISNQASLSVATIPYPVKIPYAVFETAGTDVKALKEKPELIFYSNAGIYMIQKEAVHHIPADEPYNATDLMEVLISKGSKVLSYPLHGYWLDIGKPDDFQKAQEDVKHIRF